MSVMKEDREKLKELEKLIIPTLRRNDVIRAGLFGSFVRGGR